MSSPAPNPTSVASKAPPAILMFWMVKICATTAGETGGDALSMSMGWGYGGSTMAFLALFAGALALQLRTRRYHATPYWLLVVATTTVGTTTSDFIDRTLHVGYVASSAGLLALVVAVLVAWRLTTGAVRADHVSSGRDELFYWLTILVSNTLGTALGDFAADGTGLALGFERGALVFAALIAVVAALRGLRALPAAVLFWAAYVLTRPLGATFGDVLTKPVAAGGLSLDRLAATGAILAAMALLVLATPRLRRSAPVAPGAATA